METNKFTFGQLSNWFILFKGSEAIKLRKGMTKHEVIGLLGEPHSSINGNNPKNIKLVFKLAGYSFGAKWYEIFFREDILEWSSKINSKK